MTDEWFLLLNVFELEIKSFVTVTSFVEMGNKTNMSMVRVVHGAVYKSENLYSHDLLRSSASHALHYFRFFPFNGFQVWMNNSDELNGVVVLVWPMTDATPMDRVERNMFVSLPAEVQLNGVGKNVVSHR